jgi:hypothetical protein
LLWINKIIPHVAASLPLEAYKTLFLSSSWSWVPLRWSICLCSLKFICQNANHQCVCARTWGLLEVFSSWR